MKKVATLFFVFCLCVLVIHAQNSKGLKVISNETPSQEGKTYALIVGISKYKDPAIPQLQFADKDAIAFRNYLISRGVDSSNISLLLNENANRLEVLMQLRDYCLEKLKQGDTFYFYFSGHGDVESKVVTKAGYLLPYDAPYSTYSINAIEVSKVQEFVATASSKGIEVIVITDACRSGKIAGGLEGLKNMQSLLKEIWKDEIKILSCQPGEQSLEGMKWRNGGGLFTDELINGLSGLADSNNDHVITLRELNLYLLNMVPKEAYPENQNPILTGDMNSQLAKVTERTKLNISASESSGTVVLNHLKGTENIDTNNLDKKTLTLYNQFSKAIENNHLFNERSSNEVFAYDIINEIAKKNKNKQLVEQLKMKLCHIVIDNISEFIITSQNFPWRTRASIRLGYNDRKELDFIFDYLGLHQLDQLGLLSKYYYCKSTYLKQVSSNELSINSDTTLIDSAIYYDPLASYAYNLKGFNYLNYFSTLNAAVFNLQKSLYLSPSNINANLNLAYCYRYINYDSSNYFFRKSLALFDARNTQKIDSELGIEFNYYDDFSRLINDELLINYIITDNKDSVRSCFIRRGMLESAKYGSYNSSNDSSYILNSAADVCSQMEDTKKAVALRLEALQTAPKYFYYKMEHNFARELAAENNLQESLLYLELSIKKNDDDYESIQSSQRLKSIRSLPEFIALMKKYFPNQYEDK